MNVKKNVERKYSGLLKFPQPVRRHSHLQGDKVIGKVGDGRACKIKGVEAVSAGRYWEKAKMFN